ncbi:unnamed protein product [Rotaria sp. Silwood1]|nr:unnamed protein product [Rotaria sp. Silwood1]
MIKELVCRLFSAQCQLKSLRLDISNEFRCGFIHRCLSSNSDLSPNLIQSCNITLRRLHIRLNHALFLESLIEYVPNLEQISVEFDGSLKFDTLWKSNIESLKQSNENWFNKIPKLQCFSLKNFIDDDLEFSYLKWLLNNLNFVKKLQIYIKSVKLDDRKCQNIWKCLIDANFIRQYCLPDRIPNLIDFNFYICSQCQLSYDGIEKIINSFKIHSFFISHQWTNVKCLYDSIMSCQHFFSSFANTFRIRYVYFAAPRRDDKNENHRMFVIENTNADPFTGTLAWKGQITDATNKWAIDRIVFELSSDISYIAQMSNPWMISSTRVEIARPIYYWETNHRPYVNEGPQVIIRNRIISLVYLTSRSWTDDYYLGLITVSTISDLMKASSWQKRSNRIFHSEDWIIYHSTRYSGSGWTRQIRTQQFTWSIDSILNLGSPVITLLKVDYDNQLSMFIAAGLPSVEITFDLMVKQKHFKHKITCNPGKTHKATLTLPKEFPLGAGELTLSGTGGLHFNEKHDIIVHDNCHIILVQTSASSYHPGDTMKVRVIVIDEYLRPIEYGEVILEIYDAAHKLVGEFKHVLTRKGVTDVLEYPLDEHVNVGAWLVSATIRNTNTTSSVQVLVFRPMTPSFNLKAIFPRFLLRKDQIILHGAIEINDVHNQPTVGRAMIAIGPLTEKELESKMKRELKAEESSKNEEWSKWKSQKFEIGGRVELNYDLSSTFYIDTTKAIGIQVYIQVTDLISAQQRIIHHIIPIFTHNILYDIRPLDFEAGINNQFEIIAKRPDGKPVEMKHVIVTIKMIKPSEYAKTEAEKVVKIKNFSRLENRNDIGVFDIAIPEDCIGVLMDITSLSEDGKVSGYRTHALPLMPKPRRHRHDAKLSIKLLSSTEALLNTDSNIPTISSQSSTVAPKLNFSIELIPSKPIENFEQLLMSYVLTTNGRITHIGEFSIERTKEEQSLTCVFKGTLSILMTRDMVPYSTLLVYTFQPTLGFNVAESYRFSVDGLFQSSLTLNATIVSFMPIETIIKNNDDFMEEMNVKPIHISDTVQNKKCVELSFTGKPNSTVGLNVFEYDAVLQGLSNEIIKERLLKYLTTYEQVPMVSIPTMNPSEVTRTKKESEAAYGTIPQNKVLDKRQGVINEKDEKYLINRERMRYKVCYPIEKMIFGVSSSYGLPVVEGDDIYTTSNIGRFYSDEQIRRPISSHYRHKFEKSINQYDVIVGNNDDVVATSMPLVSIDDKDKPTIKHKLQTTNNVEIHFHEEPMHEPFYQYGTLSWYEKINSELKTISPEVFTFMRSGLTIISDCTSLRIPPDMKHENFKEVFSKFPHYSTMFMNDQSFDIRDQARQLLEDYLVQSDLSLVPPSIMFEERSHTGYYRSVFFGTSRINSDGIGKILLPRIKPYSTWLATGFALNNEFGLSIAKPIRLPINQGLFVLGSCPKQVKINERVLLTYAVTNYLGTDLTNVTLRIRTSSPFQLFEESQPDHLLSSIDNDYTLTIPSLESSGVKTRHMIFIPKCAGIIQIIIEVESQFGGDYEILTIFVRESGIKRKQLSTRLFDLTHEKKKTYGPIVEKIIPSSTLRSVQFSVSGTDLDRLIKRYTTKTNTLIGIDRAIVCLYRSLGLRHYLKNKGQIKSSLFDKAAKNITKVYQSLQLYNNYDGSYSFISDKDTQHSSLYLTSLAFGAMISPMMPFHDNVTLNRTLNWILSHQQEDGSFDDNIPCFHYRFCSGKFRRESLTAIVLYSLTHDWSLMDSIPEFIHDHLYHEQNNSIIRAQNYLQSRLKDVKSNLLIRTLLEMALIQNRDLPLKLRNEIHEDLLSRKLTIVEEDDSKYLKYKGDKKAFYDELLVNTMTISICAYYYESERASNIARWLVNQIQTHPYYDIILDDVFRTEALVQFCSLFHQHLEEEKFAITIDITADNGEKKQFKIDRKNMDMTQIFEFTLPVQQITYTVSGFGAVCVKLMKEFVQKEQKLNEPIPFELSIELTTMPWLNEIKAKTCMTYTPTVKDKQLVKEDFNRAIVIEVKLPSGMRINMRKIGFMLSYIKQVMYFTYEPCGHKLIFFIKVPSAEFGKPICLEWCLERLSSVIEWAPIQVRVYDYLQQETQLIHLIPIETQPTVLGYSFVDAVQQKQIIIVLDKSDLIIHDGSYRLPTEFAATISDEQRTTNENSTENLQDPFTTEQMIRLISTERKLDKDKVRCRRVGTQQFYSIKCIDFDLYLD